jgi:tocopherol O-methyltransferase
MIHPNEPQSVADVASHYNELDPVYRALWGEHVHHGLWLTGRETAAEAVAALADRVGAGLPLKPAVELVDIGCGYGATARRFAARHGARVTGLTLSAAQAAQAPPADGVRILVRDWLDNFLPAGGFDGAYAIESTEHMADKAAVFAEAHRVLRPGGRLVVCAWLAAERAGPAAIRHLLEPICREGRLASMGTETEYRALAEGAGFRLVGFEDLSRRVRRTWTLCAWRFLGALVTDPECRRLVASPRTRNRIFALSLPRLILAYRTGAMRYGLGIWEKPSSGTPPYP